MSKSNSTNSADKITQLYRSRPKSRFLRWSMLVVLLMGGASWLVVDVDWGTAFSLRRVQNLNRFIGEINPIPNQEFSWTSYFAWVLELWYEKGASAALTTLWISFAAIFLSGATAILCVFPASRNFSSDNPFTLSPGSASNSLRWRCLVAVIRGLFVFTRAIPEYIWGFLMIAIFGPSVWPAILALMIHNFGILGKLGAEVVENTDPAIPESLRSIGLKRTQVAITGVAPMSLSKWLLIFFYRWETCIREATVLGMLGIVSLGYLLRESRARDRYDEMIAFVILGSLLVLFADVTSAIVRRYLRTH